LEEREKAKKVGKEKTFNIYVFSGTEASHHASLRLDDWMRGRLGDRIQKIYVVFFYDDLFFPLSKAKWGPEGNQNGRIELVIIVPPSSSSAGKIRLQSTRAFTLFFRGRCRSGVFPCLDVFRRWFSNKRETGSEEIKEGRKSGFRALCVCPMEEYVAAS